MYVGLVCFLNIFQNNTATEYFGLSVLNMDFVLTRTPDVTRRMIRVCITTASLRLELRGKQRL